MEDAYWRMEARLKAKTEMLEAYKKLDENMRNVKNRMVGEAKVRSGLEDKNGELEAQIQDLRTRLEVEQRARAAAEDMCRKFDSDRYLSPLTPISLFFSHFLSLVLFSSITAEHVQLLANKCARQNCKHSPFMQNSQLHKKRAKTQMQRVSQSKRMQRR